MSLIRQLWLLLLGTVLVAVAGSVLVSVGATRGVLETQLRLKNSDNAQALALTLSQQGGDTALAELAVAAQFDTGFYALIRLLGPDGRVLVERRAAPRAMAVPAWFVRAAPITSTPGVAQVSDGWRAIGTLEVVSDAGFAHAELWRGSLRSAGWLAAVGLLAGTLGALVVGRIRAPLHAIVEQARALIERRFVRIDETEVPELRQLGHAMNTLVQRLQAVFAEQGAQIEQLRRSAQTDALTGLAHRAHGLAHLSALHGREDAPAQGSLLLLRVRMLATLNRELGHAEADALLCALAALLRRHGEAAPDALACRLNGADFMLLTPQADTHAVARDLQAALQHVLARWPAASVALGAVAWQPSLAVSALMQAADATLARAEAQHGFGLAVDTETLLPTATERIGANAWRQRLLTAIEQADATLGAYPVVDSAGRLVHLEAPLRLRLQPGGVLEPAARWLPWALRGGLGGDADLLAVRLALDAIAADGHPRGVNLAVDSLADSRFVPRLRELLSGRHEAAALWLEVGEQAAVAQLALVTELGRQLRPLGVRIGLEHAGARLASIERLYEAGLDYVKLDATLSRELGSDRARSDFLRGLVSMLHGLGVTVYAEGVSTAGDAELLWRCGLDGLTGPWVGAMAAPPSVG